MSRYIDVDKFIEDKRNAYCKDCDMRKGVKNGVVTICYDIGDAPCRICGINDMLDELDDYTTADVEEVRHGEWIDTGFGGIHGDTLYRCSCCGEEREAYVDEERFCPNCGAKMD